MESGDGNSETDATKIHIAFVIGSRIVFQLMVLFQVVIQTYSMGFSFIGIGGVFFDYLKQVVH